MSSYRLGQGKWVFIDWEGIWPGYGADQQGRDLPFGFLMPYGIEIRAHKPRLDPDAVLAAEHPWESRGVHAWTTFLEDGGRFRCWYHVPLKGDVALGYAESQDGVQWSKPILGLTKHEGSIQNNLVALPSRGGVEQSHHVFIDPSAPPSERYKMVSSCESRDALALYGAVSADGLVWNPLPGDPVILKNRADTQNICAYDEELKKYVVFTRQAGFAGHRGINRAESSDFLHFPPSEPIFTSTPLEPPDWDYYTNGYSRWPGAVGAHLMRFSVYHRTQDTVDVHLAISRNGRIWHRPLGRDAWVDDTPPFPSPYRTLYACAGILRTAPGEWSTYLNVAPEGHNQKGPRTPRKILRAVSREDGFVSLYAKDRGEFFTLDFNLDADRILLNVRTGASGFVRCAILAADGGTPEQTLTTSQHPVPVYRGFTLEDCAMIRGDHLDIPLFWKADLRQLHGKSIQLQFELFNADLYAIDFVKDRKD